MSPQRKLKPYVNDDEIYVYIYINMSCICDKLLINMPSIKTTIYNTRKQHNERLGDDIETEAYVA